VYVGHESQVPAVGDYRTTAIGRQPVIVSRHEDGEIYVLLNRCRHRGSVVCRDEVGHSRSVVPAIEMIRSGRHPLDLLSTHRFPLERTHEALDLAGRRTNPSAIHVSVLPAPNGAMR
jgi:threonine dehydrogenase-like Zn-dependent dehydrogenase